MFKSQCCVALVLAIFAGITPVMAADTAQKTPASETGQLETISGVPAEIKQDHKECPMHHKGEKCDHKNGEPCPYHDKGNYDKKHHPRAHEKCEFDQHKQ
jgi:hypothetical protein